MAIFLKLAVLFLGLAWLVFAVRRMIIGPSVPAANAGSAASATPADQSPRGSKLIRRSAGAAAAVIFLDWLVGLASVGTSVGLGMAPVLLLWAYPWLAARNRWRMHADAARLCAWLTVLVGLVEIVDTSRAGNALFNAYASSLGATLHLLCAIAMLIGVRRYAKDRPLAAGD